MVPGEYYLIASARVAAKVQTSARDPVHSPVALFRIAFEAMNRAGQILLEVLVAGILLALVIPNIRPLCWKYAGPDWVAYYGMVAENNALIAQNEQKAAEAALKERLASLETERQRQAHVATVAQADAEHRRAMTLYDAFTERQVNLYARCLGEADGKLDRSHKDRLINQIWMSSGYIRTCQELPNIN